MGHMRQTPKNWRSTKPHKTPKPTTTITKPDPTTNNHVYLSIEDINRTGRIYTDQTGRFPMTSARGYRYMIIAYNQDTNHIFAFPLKSRTGKELHQKYKEIRTEL